MGSCSGECCVCELLQLVTLHVVGSWEDLGGGKHFPFQGLWPRS